METGLNREIVEICLLLIVHLIGHNNSDPISKEVVKRFHCISVFNLPTFPCVCLLFYIRPVFNEAFLSFNDIINVNIPFVCIPV